MNDSPVTPQAVSPRRLWGLRLATVVAMLPPSILATYYLANINLNGWGGQVTAELAYALRYGLAVLVVLGSAVIPYIFILWHTRKNPPQENGRVWALGTGGAWLALFGAFILPLCRDLDFVSDPGTTEGLIWGSATWALLCLPHAGVITFAMKVYSPTEPGLMSSLADGKVRLCTKVLQAATGSMILLLLFPVLYLFYLSGRSWLVTHWQIIALIWLMVLCAEVPYAFLLTRLRGQAGNRGAMALATGLAAGWLAILINVAINGNFFSYAPMGRAERGYWVSSGLIQIAALISAQGIDRALARAGLVRWKLPWRFALPPICFGVFLYIIMDAAKSV